MKPLNVVVGDRAGLLLAGRNRARAAGSARLRVADDSRLGQVVRTKRRDRLRDPGLGTRERVDARGRDAGDRQREVARGLRSPVVVDDMLDYRQGRRSRGRRRRRRPSLAGAELVAVLQVRLDRRLGDGDRQERARAQRPPIRGAVIIGLTHGTHECFVLCARVSLVRSAGELLVR